jgi:hypothetical protein
LRFSPNLAAPISRSRHSLALFRAVGPWPVDRLPRNSRPATWKRAHQMLPRLNVLVAVGHRLRLRSSPRHGSPADPAAQQRLVEGPALARLGGARDVPARRRGLQRALALAGNGDRPGHFDALRALASPSGGISGGKVFGVHVATPSMQAATARPKSPLARSMLRHTREALFFLSAPASLSASQAKSQA